MSRYYPGAVPEDAIELRQFIQDELYAIADEIDNRKWTNSFERVTTSTRVGSRAYIFADASGGAITLTVPSPPDVLLLNIKKVDSSGNVVTIDAGTGKTIDGSQTYTGLNAQYNSVVRYWDTTEWVIG